MKSLGILGLVGIVIVAVGLLNSFFIVDQREQALVLQVGRAVEAYNEPGSDVGEADEAGLKFKIPFWQSVVKYDRRNLGIDIPNIEALAADQEQLIVDAFVRWRISDPLAFYQRLGTQREGERQLNQFTNAAIRNALGTRLPEDIISGSRSELMDEIRENLGASIAGRGISIIDVRIRRADLPVDVSERVFSRMQAARNQQAEQIRAEGAERAKGIRARAERDRTVLLAEARRDAEQIRGSGDAQRNEIYANAYQQDEEFFRFQRALIACEESFDEGSRLVLGPESLGLCDQFMSLARTNGQRR